VLGIGAGATSREAGVVVIMIGIWGCLTPLVYEFLEHVKGFAPAAAPSEHMFYIYYTTDLVDMCRFMVKSGEIFVIIMLEGPEVLS
jgi:hypothetical protein